MWIFVAKYIDMDSDKEVTKDITFSDGILESERDGYMYAMASAYEYQNARPNLLFSSLEFIAC